MQLAHITGAAVERARPTSLPVAWEETAGIVFGLLPDS